MRTWKSPTSRPIALQFSGASCLPVLGNEKPLKTEQGFPVRKGSASGNPRKLTPIFCHHLWGISPAFVARHHPLEVPQFSQQSTVPNSLIQRVGGRKEAKMWEKYEYTLLSVVLACTCSALVLIGIGG